jgi:glucose/arabinose dehydrogenase
MSHVSITRLTLTLLLLAGALAPVAQAQYTIPLDNPFVTNPLARGEISVYGMRNPYRWSFDRLTGDMWIGDVGGTAPDQEEITHLTAGSISGANLGWNCFSGTLMKSACTPANYYAPVHTYPSGPDVVIGGYVVRDPDLPAFAGRYLFGRLNTGIYQLEANGSATKQANVAALSAFGEDGVGHLYVTSLTGPVYRLSQNGSALATSSIGNFEQPLAVAAPPGDTTRLFVVQKTGIVKLRTGTQVSDFLDLTSLITTVGSEQGLLAFAVAPDYPTSGRVFAYYTNKSNDLQLDEFRRTADNPDRADLATRKPILTIQHDQAQNHNGGQLLFGRDGMLYLSTGDGGTQNDPEGDAQSLASLLGKILRLDVGIPPAAIDRVAPTLRTKAKSPQRLLRLRGAIAYVRCSENCAVIAGGRLHVGKREYRLRRVRKLGPDNKRVRLKVPLGSKARKAIAGGLKRHSKIRLDLTLRGRDATGNRSRLVTRVVRVRR